MLKTQLCLDWWAYWIAVVSWKLWLKWRFIQAPRHPSIQTGLLSSPDWVAKFHPRDTGLWVFHLQCFFSTPILTPLFWHNPWKTQRKHLWGWRPSKMVLSQRGHAWRHEEDTSAVELKGHWAAVQEQEHHPRLQEMRASSTAIEKMFACFSPLMNQPWCLSKSVVYLSVGSCFSLADGQTNACG